MSVGVLLLAAGRGRRFGADKRLALLSGGQTVLATTLANIADSGLAVRVCLAAADTELADTLQNAGIETLLCEHTALGMGSTLADAIVRVPANWVGTLVALADMPWIQPATYRAVAAELGSGTICRPILGDRAGHPVGFGRDFFTRLASLEGDLGARDIVAERAGVVRKVPVADAGIFRDVDYPADLEEDRAE